MRILSVGILLITILVLSACNKHNADAGFWTFSGGRYANLDVRPGFNSFASGNRLTATTEDGRGILVFTFNQPPNSMPTAAGTYNVTTDSSLIYYYSFYLAASEDSGATYYRASSHSGGQTAELSFVNHGKVYITGDSIWLVNSARTDSSLVSFSIVQLH